MLERALSILSRAWQRYLDDGTFDPEAVLVEVSKTRTRRRMPGEEPMIDVGTSSSTLRPTE